MSCVLTNCQRGVRVDTRQLRCELNALLRALDYQDYMLEVVLVGSRRMRQLHREFFGDLSDTNVISFAHQKIRAGQRMPVDKLGNKILGEIFVCVPFVKDEASAWGRNTYEHLQYIIVHGLCHVLGYQHETRAQRESMERAQDYLYTLLRAGE